MKKLGRVEQTPQCIRKNGRIILVLLSIIQRRRTRRVLEVFPADKSNVRIEFEKIVHEVMLPDYDQEFISIFLNIFAGDHNVGWFKNMLLMDGTDFDEFFVIE